MPFSCRVGTFELLFKTILWIITVKKKKRERDAIHIHGLVPSSSQALDGLEFCLIPFFFFFLNFSFLFTAPKPSSASPTGKGTPL